MAGKIVNIGTEKTSSEIICQEHEFRLKRILFFSAFFCFIGLLLYLWKRNLFLFSETVDHELLGTLGDFVGGVLGTGISIYALYILTDTFKNQIRTNENVTRTNDSVIKTNEATASQMNYQIFDNKFTTLLSLYQDAIKNYGKDDLRGKKAFDALVDDFKEVPFENNWVYSRRHKAAILHYEPFYVSNRALMSIHLRMLFLLFKMLAHADIDEKTRVEYAKTIRGQLSENEMFVIRYNCHCHYGQKMQVYANQFNLLKHLPVMSLLEFYKWRDIAGTQECINALDSLFVSLRKDITGLFANESNENRSLQKEISKKYIFFIEKKERGKELIFTIQKNNVSCQGTPKPAIEVALDKFDNENLQNLFQDYFRELLVISNFQQYNNMKNPKYKRKLSEEDATHTMIEFKITKEYPIILSQRQLQNPTN